MDRPSSTTKECIRHERGDGLRQDLRLATLCQEARSTSMRTPSTTTRLARSSLAASRMHAMDTARAKSKLLFKLALPGLNDELVSYPRRRTHRASSGLWPVVDCTSKLRRRPEFFRALLPFLPTKVSCNRSSSRPAWPRRQVFRHRLLPARILQGSAIRNLARPGSKAKRRGVRRLVLCRSPLRQRL